MSSSSSVSRSRVLDRWMFLSPHRTSQNQKRKRTGSNSPYQCFGGQQQVWMDTRCISSSCLSLVSSCLVAADIHARGSRRRRRKRRIIIKRKRKKGEIQVKGTWLRLLFVNVCCAIKVYDTRSISHRHQYSLPPKPALHFQLHGTPPYRYYYNTIIKTLLNSTLIKKQAGEKKATF